MSEDLGTYYERRAAEYDAVYEKPERQADLAALKQRFPELLRGRRVLELAAGTGFWTECFAPAAASVHATDLNPAPLRVAEGRDYGGAKVTFQVADAFALERIPGQFDAAFMGFLWSHISLADLPAFLDGIARRLPSRSLVVAVDNRYVEGSNLPLTSKDVQGNTFQRRVLSDGSAWDVLKNFPEPEELRHRVQPYADDIEVELLPYFWVLRYTLR